MQAIKDSSFAKKARAVFVNLTAAYNTVWYPWLHLQVAVIATWQAHGLHDHGAGWQLQLHPSHQ